MSKASIYVKNVGVDVDGFCVVCGLAVELKAYTPESHKCSPGFRKARRVKEGRMSKGWIKLAKESLEDRRKKRWSVDDLVNDLNISTSTRAEILRKYYSELVNKQPTHITHQSLMVGR